MAANVRLHRGWFDASLPAFLAREMAVGEVALPLHVSFLHIDCDLYSSTQTVLRCLACAIGVGTVVVFDEWCGYVYSQLFYSQLFSSQVFDEWCGYVGWEEHEARAWREFCDEHGVRFQWIEPPSAAAAAAAAAGGGGGGGAGGGSSGGERSTTAGEGDQAEGGGAGPSKALLVTAIRPQQQQPPPQPQPPPPLRPPAAARKDKQASKKNGSSAQKSPASAAAAEKVAAAQQAARKAVAAREAVAAAAAAAAAELEQQKQALAAEVHARLRDEAKLFGDEGQTGDGGGGGGGCCGGGDNDDLGALLDVETLGSCRPADADPRSPRHERRPFACAVRVAVAGQSVEMGVEQGQAVVDEVVATFARGPTATSGRALRPGAQHWVLWRNLGAHSLRLEPNKSNSIVWLNKAHARRSELESSCAWPAQRALLRSVLPHAETWVSLLQRAREDGGIDIKDDCRLDDRSAKCHQDGNNSVAKGNVPLVRLALNVSSAASGRSLDYLQLSTDSTFVDGAAREAALLHSVSQHRMWHGAAQTTHGYVQGVSDCCHGSSAGTGPCLKRIVTVFALPDDHPLAALTAAQRLRRIGLSVFAIDPRHQIGTSWTTSPPCHGRVASAPAALGPASSPTPAADVAPATAAPGEDARPQPQPPAVSKAQAAKAAKGQQAVLRSSTHRAAYSRGRKADPGPAVAHAALPAALCEQATLRYDSATHDLRGAVVGLLERAGSGVGRFEDLSRDGDNGSSISGGETRRRLEDFRVPAEALRGSGGSAAAAAQQHLTLALAADAPFLAAFEHLVEMVVVPSLKARLVTAGACHAPTTFYYQYPPTLRLQPGPSSRTVRPHSDAEYGHQRGEINCWMPLTDRLLTRTTLWAESHEGAGDDHPFEVDVGEIALFHGTVCKHHVPANPSEWTRASLDFRVGIEGYFDPSWSMKGTKQDHGRRTVRL